MGASVRFLNFARAGVLALSAMAFGTPAFADYPDKPIKVIVPYGPGGSSDIAARLVVNRINELKLLPQPLVVFNIDSGEGIIGIRRVKDAEPDGYELLFQQPALLASAVTKRIPFSHEAFDMIAATGSAKIFFVVKEGGRYNSFADVVKAAKEKPGEIPTASLIGGTTQVAGLLASKGAGVKFRLVHVGGADKRIKSLLGDHTEHTTFSTAETLSFLASGIKPVMVLANERTVEFPNVPSAKELGYDAEFSAENWWFAPKNTPKDRVAKLVEVWGAAMKDETLLKQLREKGFSTEFRTGDGMRQHIDRIYDRIKGLSDDLNAK